MKAFSAQRRETVTAWLLVAPFIALLLILLLVPFAAILLKSFSSSTAFGLPYLSGQETLSSIVPTLSNYALVLNDPHNREVIVRTLAISVVVATILAVVGIAVGYYMARRPRIAPALSAIVTYPSLAPAITIIFGILWFISSTGPINHLLFQTLEWINEPLELTGTFAAVVIGDLALFATISVRMTASLFEMVDVALEDASSSLGATERETFFNIVLPLVLPGVAAIWIFVFIRTMVAYVAALILGGGSKGVVVLPLEIFNRIQSLGISGTMAQICAFAVVLAVITLLGRFLYVLVVRRLFRGTLSVEAL
jgi:ABC-type spermidine/putrescine transport system permease subunit I